MKNEVTNVPLFLRDTIALFQPMALEKNIQITTAQKDDMPLVKIDDDKLFKIVSNLLTNAIKYSEEGARVSLSFGLEKQTLKVVVADTGIGIAPKDQEQVFRKFYQVDATITRKGEGTGLGLAFVKELVQLMDGQIQLESELNKGTEVTVTLPVEKLDKPAEATDTDIANPSLTDNTEKSVTIGKSEEKKEGS